MVRILCPKGTKFKNRLSSYQLLMYNVAKDKVEVKSLRILIVVFNDDLRQRTALISCKFQK